MDIKQLSFCFNESVCTPDASADNYSHLSVSLGTANIVVAINKYGQKSDMYVFITNCN